MPEYTAFTDAPAYTESSIIAECSRVVNFRREPLLSQQGKNKFALLRQPGLTEYANLDGYANYSRGAIAISNAIVVPGPGNTLLPATVSPATRMFVVQGAVLLEIGGPPTKFIVNYGTVAVAPPDDGKRAYMAASPTQLAIVSGGSLIVFNLTFTGIISSAIASVVTVGLIGTPNCVSYMDGFFVLTFQNSTQYQLSAINDATTWDPTQVTSANARPDFILGVHEMKERLWFMGSSQIESVYNAGEPIFPFLTDISSVYNYGLLAPASLEQLSDSLFFLGSEHTGEGSGAGQAAAYKIQGQAIVKISNPAIDAIFATYKNQTDAYGWCYWENGHPCWRVSFPNVDDRGNSVTWEYDDSLGPVMGWTEVPYFTGQVFQSHLGFCCVNAYGLILVGSRARPEDDPLSPTLQRIYSLSSQYLDDNGQPMYRLRRTPHMYNSSKRIYLDRIEFDGNDGIGLEVAQGQPYWMAQSTLEVSYDGGRTFPNAWQISWGIRGDRKSRAYKAHMGSGYDIVVQLTCTDPVDYMISACSLDTQLGLA
jgi:hypothetical protein